MDLYQAEWCPHSHEVRQRLTELGLDFQARQVPADPSRRSELELVAEEILSFLERYEPRPDADEHRDKAAEEVPTFAEVKRAA